MKNALQITNTSYFVPNKKAVIKSLFIGKGTTANGTFKALKNRVMFYDMKGELFAALIVNRNGDEPFFVNAFMHNGKPHYSYALGDIQARKLGIDGCSYMTERDYAKAVAYDAGLWGAK